MFVRFCALFCALFSFILADFTMPANITALKVRDNSVLVGLDNGELVEYKDESITTLAILPKISNHFNKDINSRIYQIDFLNDMIVSLAEANDLNKQIAITKNGQTSIIAQPINQLKQVLFLDDKTLLLMGPNCEVNFYDIASKKITHTSKWTLSGFEKAIIDRKENLLLIVCEGGIIFYYDLAAKKVIKEEPVHKDRIYDIAKFNDRIITGSPERKTRYFDGNAAHIYDLRFPSYKVTLNEDFGAYTTENSIVIIDKNGAKINEIAYSGTLLTDLEFFKPDELVGAGYDKTLHFWSIK